MRLINVGALCLSGLLSVQCAQAQASMAIDWPLLVEPEAQIYEDPYRDLTRPQFLSLMEIARLQIAMGDTDSADSRADMEARAGELVGELRAQGLDPEWILSQREAVAAKRERAALATNSTLEGEHIEMTGFLLVAVDADSEETVAYLLPDRGVCMHLPPPVPNQLVRLNLKQLPEPLGNCISAAVRGRLTAGETRSMVPVFDHTVPLWSGWRLDVSAVTTTGTLPADGG